ncbi:MAG TPA: SPOR domain-containing protein [Gemmatimonadaceae bacterium]|nr:SPOR domain-containing protein [Gemmatimonadaceae bacterium]
MKHTAAVSLVVSTLLVLGCGHSDQRTVATPHGNQSAASTTRTAPNPDAVILRIPRAGGPVRAYAYARLDSALWTSTAKAPSVSRVLAFDEDRGSVALIDGRGALRRIDLRVGDVSPPPTVKLAALASSDGAAVYGIQANGSVARLTTTDATPWTFTPPHPAREVAPRADGTVIIVGGGRGDQSILWRVRPPESRVLDSAQLPPAERLIRTQLGDRLYLVADSAIAGVRGRDLAPIPSITFPRRIQAVAATPSGDRLYVALDSTAGLQVVDRYTDRVVGSVDLSGAASEMRMDPLGRALLVRPTTGDSAWIVAVGTDRVTGTVHTNWTADLPFVAADGLIAVDDYPDVDFVDASGIAQHTVTGGAKDFWIPIHWNGFRPRAPGLDQPVTFPGGGAADSTDTIAQLIQQSQHDSTPTATRVPPPGPPLPVPHRPDTTGRPTHAVVDTAHGSIGTRIPAAGFTVQFAAVLNEGAARTTAAQIAASGSTPRVVPSRDGSMTIYHVVLGPFPSRAEADAAGRAAHHQFWIYQGAP